MKRFECVIVETMEVGRALRNGAEPQKYTSTQSGNEEQKGKGSPYENGNGHSCGRE